MYHARQPTNENVTITTDTPYSADMEITFNVSDRKEYIDNTSDAVFREENADMQKSVQKTAFISDTHTVFTKAD